MRKILVCQHVPYEGLGTLIPLFKQERFRIRFVNFGRYPDAKPDLKGYDGLIILGGPMSVDQVEDHPHLLHEVQLIREAMGRDLPLLGICLGAQLIAKTLSAKVSRNPVKELGWQEVCLLPGGKEDPLFRHFNKTENIFQWHPDAFELPTEGINLAASTLCTHQAFRVGKNTYGFQFHLEVNESMIDRWIRLGLQRGEIQENSGEPHAEQIRKESRQNIERSKQLSGHVFGEFVKLFGEEKRFRRLHSR